MMLSKDINQIPIAYSTDDNYALPVAVSIKSIIENSNRDNFIFVILYNKYLSDKSKSMINTAIKDSQSIVKYIDIKDAIKNTYLKIPHISESTYYRILLPSILKEYDKCIYLDGDTIVLGDIDILMKEELSSNEYIGGVRCESLINSVFTYRKEHLKEIGIESLKNYINAGVLLLNLDALRQNNLVGKMIDMIDRKFSIQDQDIYNVSCYGHIKIIHPKYNVTPGILEKTLFELRKAYSFKDINEARKNPIVIHFADKRKPWNYIDMKYGTQWDRYYDMLFKLPINNRKNYCVNSFLKRNAIIIKNAIKFFLK